MGFESLPWLEIMKWRRKPAIGRRPLIFSDVDRIRMIEPLLPFRMKRRSVFRLSNFSSVWKWGEKVRESQRRRQREAEGGRGRERGGSVVNPNHGGSSSKIINYQKWKKKKYIYIYEIKNGNLIWSDHKMAGSKRGGCLRLFLVLMEREIKNFVTNSWMNFLFRVSGFSRKSASSWGKKENKEKSNRNETKPLPLYLAVVTVVVAVVRVHFESAEIDSFLVNNAGVSGGGLAPSRDGWC